MYTDFAILSYRIAGDLDGLEIQAKLVGQGEIADFGARGFRFIPRNRQWPTTYFNPDGTLDVVTKDLYLDEILTYLETLSETLGVRLMGRYMT